MMKTKEKRSTAKTVILAALVIFTMLFVFAYLLARTVLFFIAPFMWYEKIVAFLLLCVEIFILIHGFGYFLNLLNIILYTGIPRKILKPSDSLSTYPPVAIIVSSFKEPLEVVEETLTCFYNLTYPNKHLFFLDDTRYDLPGDDPRKMESYRYRIDDLCQRIGINLFRRKWRGAKAGMINDFLDFVEKRHRTGFEFYPYSDLKRTESEKYIIVFDADMNPFPDFVEGLVSLMESNPKLAFVQTPQYYSNFETNRVARASGLQQAIFYEYICEGKSLKDAMFCCGTNVIFRREALMDVGGFDESSVTEDFATSLKFHIKGWSSAYVNKVCAFGMGPEDLGGYFKQQFRWSLGTMGLFRNIVGRFLRNPLRLPAAKWWEYFLSGSHYFIGWVFFIMVYCPILYLFFEVPSFFARPEIYLLFFAPYVILSLTMFFGTLGSRGYRIKELFTGIVLNAISFPIFIKAATLAMLGVKGSFGITPKGQSHALPLTGIWFQLATAVISFAAVVWGLFRLYYEREPAAAIIVNSLWSLYHFFILSTILYFNHPKED